ncbi:hypothetical protein [Streptomyces ardesiacus]|uniref:hypothetical protein n=1 Tax=Streptomyces ardesiacus TaxID=285564 RepID=UPI0036BB6712
MPERLVTMPGSTDQFVLPERPVPTPAHRYLPLPLPPAWTMRRHHPRPCKLKHKTL